ncbi:unnamed protein product [Strongylus vulgaris]|uniref:Ig-like domain-containing protein n=1 Tax=Strongylus vulgaris TaxID=40348 RepID=A0A3P7JJZ2_STRVU|nr:unnamed protein product [Strongylus vulgaris]
MEFVVSDPEDGAPVIIEHPLDVIVSKGSPATLNCAAKPPGAQITWYKDGQPVTTNKDQVNRKNGKDGDSGSYHCVARNEHGEAQSREGTLKIAMLRDDFRTRPRTVQLSEIPRMTLHPDGNLIIEPVEHGDSGTYQCVATNMDVTVDVGSSVLFDCRVSGEPQPQISWKKKNDQMPVARAYIAKDNRGLRIDRLVRNFAFWSN